MTKQACARCAAKDTQLMQMERKLTPLCLNCIAEWHDTRDKVVALEWKLFLVRKKGK